MSKIIYCIQVSELHNKTWTNTGKGFSDEKDAADYCKQELCKGLCRYMNKKDFEALFARFGVASDLACSFEKAEGISEKCDLLLKMEEAHPGMIKNAVTHFTPSTLIRHAPVTVEGL